MKVKLKITDRYKFFNLSYIYLSIGDILYGMTGNNTLEIVNLNKEENKACVKTSSGAFFYKISNIIDNLVNGMYNVKKMKVTNTLYFLDGNLILDTESEYQLEKTIKLFKDYTNIKEAINNAFKSTEKPIEKHFELELNDYFTLCGKKSKVSKAKMNQFFITNLQGNNDQYFDIIKKDKKIFPNKILGYKTTGQFPVCKTLKDLEKLVNAIQTKYLKLTTNPSKIKICDKTHNIRYTFGSYYFVAPSKNLWYNILGYDVVTRTKFFKETLGYAPPFFKTLEDLYILAEAINKKYYKLNSISDTNPCAEIKLDYAKNIKEGMTVSEAIKTINNRTQTRINKKLLLT